MQKKILTLSTAIVASLVISAVRSAEPVPKIDEADFDRLHAMIQPCPGESPWREINWLTNITEARELAREEDKPLVIFTAADGSPLGRT